MNPLKKTRIAIVGAGIGGLALAASLRRLGFEATVYEQAAKFTRVGAGIQVSPNALMALRGLGLEPLIRRTAHRPAIWSNRVWDTGETKYELQLGREAEALYGAPYLQMHRGDLHKALLSAVPKEWLQFGKRLLAIEHGGNGARLSFEDGEQVEADLVIGADGVHSRIREALIGEEEPAHTGRTAYRTTFSASLLPRPIGPCTKWWGEDRHIVIYYVTRLNDEVYFVTSLPEPNFHRDSWSAIGDLDELRSSFVGFHQEVQDTLAAATKVHRWAILQRAPLAEWHNGQIVLLGDAAHPMTPYMAQGAAMALEDGVILARALDWARDLPEALECYQAVRQARTAKVQAISKSNSWMSTETDPGWCYKYDAWSAPIADVEEFGAG